MNKIICLILLFVPFMLVAQHTQGEAKYKETVKLEIKLPPEMEAQMKDQIPKERSFPRVLYFNQEASLYKNGEVSEEDRRGPGGGHWQGRGGGGMRVNMRMSRPENRMYKNLADGTVVEQRDFMDKKFLIDGEVEKFSWKLAMEQKEIGGYTCQKATYSDTSMSVEVWFTPQIPVSTGPGKLGGLPGLILEANYNDGKRLVVMEEINFEEPNSEEFVQPKKGKKVTHEEFKAIQKEKMEEMRKEMGGGPGGGAHGGNMIIIRSN